MKFLRLKNAGFTLVEILVAVSILAVLASMAVLFFSNAQKNDRDQKRLRDLQAVKQGLELYRNDHQSYPATLVELPSSYLDPQPTDSTAGRQYGYKGFKGSLQACTTAARDCASFVLCASQEGNNTFNIPAECSNLSCGSSPCALGTAND